MLDCGVYYDRPEYLRLTEYDIGEASGEDWAWFKQLGHASLPRIVMIREVGPHYDIYIPSSTDYPPSITTLR